MKAFDPVTLATPLFILLVIGEIVLGRLKAAKAFYEPGDTAASLLMGLGSTIAGVIFGGVVVGASLWVYQHRLFTIPMTAVWAWIVLFLLEDMTYYWFHRISHERRFRWASHVNHHSSQHYNLSTALRQTWTGQPAGTWLLWLPLSLLGFPPAMVAIQKGISLVYQFWIHTETIGRLGPPEAVLNSPSHHRVHHGSNRRYLDRNHGSILIVWDRLFGTFEPEDEPVVYGLTKNVDSFNVGRIASHEYADILADVAASTGWAERLSYVVRGPGWAARHRAEKAMAAGTPVVNAPAAEVSGAAPAAEVSAAEMSAVVA